MTAMTETYYTVLGVPPNATDAEIKRAYRDLMKQVHPDSGAGSNAPEYWKKLAEEKTKDINEAYSVLSNPDKRRLYDQQLDAYRRSQERSQASSARAGASRRQSAPGAARAGSQTQGQAKTSHQSQQQAQPPPSGSAPTTQGQARPHGQSQAQGSQQTHGSSSGAAPAAQPQTAAPVSTPAPKPKSRAAKITATIVAVWIAVLLLGKLISFLQRQATSSSPMQVGVFSTATGVSGWRNYSPQGSFLPGDVVYLYAEALNINHGGRADVSFTFRITGPTGVTLPLLNGHYLKESADPSCADWDKLQIPADGVPGTYIAEVEIRDNLSNQSLQRAIQFSVAAKEEASANPAATLDLDGIWHGFFDEYNALSGVTTFDLQVHQSGTQLSGEISENGERGGRTFSDVNGKIEGTNIQFVKSYRGKAAQFTYTGTISGDGSTMTGDWSGWGRSGRWKASRELSAGVPNRTPANPAVQVPHADDETGNDTPNPQEGYLTIHATPPGTAVNINNGWAQFSGDWSDNPCPPGTYTITASAKGMKTETHTVDLKAGQRATVEFNLSPEPESASTAPVLPSNSAASHPLPTVEASSKPTFALQLAGSSQLYRVAVSLLARPDTTYLFIYWSNSGGNQVVKLSDISKVELKHRTLEFNPPGTLFQFGIGGPPKPKVDELVVEVRDERKKKFTYHFVSSTAVCRVGSPCQEGTDGGQGLRDLATAIQGARNALPANN